MAKHIFYVQGMHCSSCPLFVEAEVGSIVGVRQVKANLDTGTVEVDGEFEVGDIDQNITDLANDRLVPFGYKISKDRQKEPVRWGEFNVALPAALIVIISFIILQKFGFIDLIQSDRVTYGTAFVIGLVASISSCMAVVGGLVLSMSAQFTKSGDAVRPQLFFHIGRLVSFFLLGGVIGALGTAFTLNGATTFILSIVIGMIMLILGLNLLNIFSWTNKLIPHIPKSWSKRAISIRGFNHSITPLLVGIVTFFLPCGFTQSMQIYTLTTGDFLSGGLTMLAFALGTLPVLAIVSFSGAGIKNKANSGIFFKTAGLIVIFFALLNIISSLVVVGIIPPFFNL